MRTEASGPSLSHCKARYSVRICSYCGLAMASMMAVLASIEPVTKARTLNMAEGFPLIAFLL